MYILHEDLTVLFRVSALSPKPLQVSAGREPGSSLGGCYGNTTSTLGCSTFLWFTACLSFAILTMKYVTQSMLPQQRA